MCCSKEEMVTDYISKPTQGGLFVVQINTIRGIEINNVEMHKSWYERFSRKCDLWDNEEEDFPTI